MSRHCFIIHPFLIQGVVFYLMIISNFEGKAEDVPVLIEITAPDCNREGGFLIMNACVCKPGFTGSRCEVMLYDVSDGKSAADGDSSKYAKEISFDVSAVDWLAAKSRSKRQADGSGDDGSAELSTAETATGNVTTVTVTDNVTNAVPASSAAIVATTAASPACNVGQTLNNAGACVDVLRFAADFVIAGQLTPEQRTFSSNAAQNLKDNITSTVAARMANTSYVGMEITGFRSGSIIVSADVFFDRTSGIGVFNASHLLQRNLVLGTSPIAFESVVLQDFNDCLLNVTNNCSGSGQICVNTEGSFSCACTLGYRRSQSGSCESLCDNLNCLNNGQCDVNSQNQVFCRCSALFAGTRCEQSVYPIRSAAIAMGVILAVFVFLAVALIVILVCRHRARSERISNDVPLVTRFRQTSDNSFGKSYDNPDGVALEESQEPLPHKERNSSSDGASNRLSTFKPDDKADTPDDDKL